MSVSPADFELYSRVTGTPLPRTPQEQMQLAPRVHQFIQNRGYQRPKGFLGEVGGYLKNAALLGGGLALANYLSNNNDDSDDGIRVDLSSPGSVDASVVPQRLITGVKDVIGTQPSPAPTPTPQTPAPRENVGTVGSITRDLGSQIDRSDIWGGDIVEETPSVSVMPRPAQKTGIGQWSADKLAEISNSSGSPMWNWGAPTATTGVVMSPRPWEQPNYGYMKPELGAAGEVLSNLGEAAGDIVLSNVPGGEAIGTAMKFAGGNILGNIPGIASGAASIGTRALELGGIGAATALDRAAYDTARSGVAARQLYNYLGGEVPTIAEMQDRAAADTAKLGRFTQNVYLAGADARRLHDENLVDPVRKVLGLPTSSYQQSAPLEIGSQSILNDHPDVVQSGTGSDEVQNNRNYIAQGNVDLEGKPITVGEFDSAYPAEMYTDYRKFGVGGGGIKYLDAGNRYGGDPEMVGKVPSQRVKDEFISSAGIPQIDEELVGGEIAESAPPEAENFHILKQFVRGLTGQDSPVDYTTEPSRQDLLNDPNASKEDLLNEMNRRREGEMAQDGPNKAAYDARQRLAKKTQMMQDLSALVNEIQASDDVIANPANFEQSQYFEPKAPKQVQWVSKTGKKGGFYDQGGGTGVESIGYRPDGYLEIDWHGKNEDKRTEGGYVFDDYVGALEKDNRDALVRDTADPRFIQGKMSPAEREEYINLGHREMDADADVYDALRDKKFGYGEGQVSPGKFAQRAKTGQGALLDFIDQNRDILRGE